MGLIAREIEGRGIPTLCMSSALSITRALCPPRAVFLDFPLGHTAGKAGEPELQRRILGEVLDAFEEIQVPGTVRELPHRWAADDGWKDAVMRPRAGSGPADERTERSATPQYQTPEDRLAAERGDCPGCVWTE